MKEDINRTNMDATLGNSELKGFGKLETGSGNGVLHKTVFKNKSCRFCYLGNIYMAARPYVRMITNGFSKLNR